MPSPVAHSLVGLAAANVPLKHRLYTSLFWFCFVLFAANAPDLDFVPGWLVGDINRFHHGISHSVGMAVVFAACASVLACALKQPYHHAFVIALVVYSTHLLADYITVDRVAPYGAPFLWPFSDEYFLAPVQLFRPVEHGSLGESSIGVLDKIFSRKNLAAAGIEFLIILPLWLLTWWLARKHSS